MHKWYLETAKNSFESDMNIIGYNRSTRRLQDEKKAERQIRFRERTLDKHEKSVRTLVNTQMKSYVTGIVGSLFRVYIV